METKKIKSKCDFIGFKKNKVNCKCKACRERYFKSINGSIKNFPNTNQFCNGDLNKLVLFLRKNVYLCEHMDSWERFDETSLSDKKAFYSKLNLEDIYDDYAHAQKVWKVFEIKNLGEYHDLYVQCDTLLLGDVFEIFRDKSIQIYGLDPAHFLSAPGSAWQGCLKKNGIKLELLTDYVMLLMDEDGIRGGMSEA